MILLPGDGYTGASTLVSGGSAAVLAGVTNPDGSTANLVFDVHQYLDSDGSGTTASCVKTSDVFSELLTWLKNSKRQALLTEIGGGSSNPSCIKNICEVIDFLNTNSDQFLGYVGWAAGSFDTSYVLGLTPNGDTDVPLMEKCFAAKFNGGAGVSPAAPVSSAAAGSISSSPVAAPASSPTSTPGPSLILPNSNPQATSTTSAPASSSSSPPLPLNHGPVKGQQPPQQPQPGGPDGQIKGQQPPQPPQPGGPDGQIKGQPQQHQPQQPQQQQPSQQPDTQDDCDAEYESVPIIAVKRNGKARFSYA